VTIAHATLDFTAAIGPHQSNVEAMTVSHDHYRSHRGQSSENGTLGGKKQ